ncbi:MAG: hypothetical protein ABIL58_07030 [Pseudomonadota bacterium]
MACTADQARTVSVGPHTDRILMKTRPPLIDRSSGSIQVMYFKNFAATRMCRLSDT